MVADRLIQGDALPPITLQLIDGRTVELPRETPGRYLALLFFRGTWCGNCRKHLRSWASRINELHTLDVFVVAASVDSQADIQQMSDDNGMGAIPLAYGVTEEDVAALFPLYWDDEHGHYVQPMEFLAQADGTLFGTLYASGSVGRMDVDDVIEAVKRQEARRAAASPAGVGA